MPYVTIQALSRDKLLESAQRRWQVVRDTRPDLAPALTLQHDLLTRVIDLSEALAAGRLPRLSLPPKYLAVKLMRGVPALAGEPIPLPVPILTPTLFGLCDALAAGGAGEAATHIRESLQGGALEPASLLTASLCRDQAALRTGAVHRGLSPDLMWLVAELAVSPYAHALQRMAGGRRGGGGTPHAALLVLLVRVGAANLCVHLLRGERRRLRHRRAGCRTEGSPHRGLRRLRRLPEND